MKIVLGQRSFQVVLVFAIGLEQYAIGTGRWAYTASMPLVPFIKTGLTPTLQLGLLGYLAYTASEKLLEMKRAPSNRGSEDQEAVKKAD